MKILHKTKFLIKQDLGLALLFCLTVACGEGGLFASPPTNPHAGAPHHPGSSGQHPGSQHPPLGTGEGVIKCTQHYTFPHFNQHLRGFLSSTMSDFRALGNVGVGCTKDQYTRFGSNIRVKGTVFFEGGKKLSLSSLNQTLEVASSSTQIKITITPIQQGAFAYGLKAAPIAGRVQGNIAVLNFEDEKGKVTLDGEIRSNSKGIIVFSAPFQYENFTAFGQPDVTGHRGTIGLLEIPACSLFDCVR